MKYLAIIGFFILTLVGGTIGGYFGRTFADKTNKNIARETWIQQNGHKTCEPCNQALREAWDKPETRTDKGPISGDCCGAGKEYWQATWADMIEHGAPVK